MNKKVYLASLVSDVSIPTRQVAHTLVLIAIFTVLASFTIEAPAMAGSYNEDGSGPTALGAIRKVDSSVGSSNSDYDVYTAKISNRSTFSIWGIEVQSICNKISDPATIVTSSWERIQINMPNKTLAAFLGDAESYKMFWKVPTYINGGLGKRLWLCGRNKLHITPVLGIEPEDTPLGIIPIDIKVTGTTSDINFTKTTQSGNIDAALSTISNLDFVVVFQHCDYGGYAVPLPVGEYTQSALGSFGINNDDIGSIHIPSGFDVVLSENDNFQGGGLALTRGGSCLKDNSFNNKASSIIVRNIGIDDGTLRWPLDTNLKEYSGTTLDGLAQNGAPTLFNSLDKAPIGFTNVSSLSFVVGLPDEMAIRIPDDDLIDFGPDDDFTVAVWIKPDATQDSIQDDTNAVVEKWDGYVGYPFVIRYHNQTHTQNGHVRVARYDGSNNPAIVSNIAINDGEWHHVAFVKSENTLKLYIDGVKDEETEDTTTGNTTNYSSLYLGRRGASNMMATSNPLWFKGSIDELRIYNRALSDAELAALTQYATGNL